MATISASQVRELRDITGAGMMECKSALTEADGDIDAAIDILRTHGLAAVAKKAGRETNEGTVMALVSGDARVGAVVELNCETDFVGINEKFKGYAKQIAQAALDSRASDVETLRNVEVNGSSVDEIVTDCVHVMGENIKLSRVGVLEAQGVCSYIHGGGKIGVLVSFDVEGIDPSSEDFQTCGRDVAMQVAATNPVSVTRDEVPAEIIEHETEIYKAQAAESGKPENIQEKMASGRLEKFYKENCIVEQDFVKNPDQTVGEYVAACAQELGGTISVKSFIRFALGE